MTTNVANTFKSPIPVTFATDAVGFGAGTTWIGSETRGMTRQNGVTSRSQKVFALSPGMPLSPEVDATRAARGCTTALATGGLVVTATESRLNPAGGEAECSAFLVTASVNVDAVVIGALACPSQGRIIAGVAHLGRTLAAVVTAAEHRKRAGERRD